MEADFGEIREIMSIPSIISHALNKHTQEASLS